MNIIGIILCATMISFAVAARKSSHRFPSAEDETAAVIDNFSPVFFTDGSFYQMYFFNFTDPALHKAWRHSASL